MFIGGLAGHVPVRFPAFAISELRQGHVCCRVDKFDKYLTAFHDDCALKGGRCPCTWTHICTFIEIHHGRVRGELAAP